MLSGPLPSGTSRFRTFPSNLIRRSNADSILQAARAPVKISDAVECRVSNTRSLTGVINLLPQPPGKHRLHGMLVARKKMVGARNQRHVLWLGRPSRRFYKFRFCGESIFVATQEKLGNPAFGQK